MITWMQKKKKYLVIILWVTVISFVGAGFVGWGSYSFSPSANGIAKVGDIKVSYSEFQRAYGNMYGFYSQNNQKIDEKMESRIKRESVELLVNQALILNYAKDLGVVVDDNEVGLFISTMQPFLKDGKFDKATYIEALKNAKYKISEFEDGIKKDLIINKLIDILALDVTDLEIKALSVIANIEDRLAIDVRDTKDLKVVVKDEDVKSFWEKNKEKYKSNATYDISYIKLTKDGVKITDDMAKEHFESNRAKYLKDDGKEQSYEEAKSKVLDEVADKIIKKEILKSSVDWKKGEITPKSLKAIPLDNEIIPADIITELEKDMGKISKPKQIKDGYIVANIEKKNQPEVLDFKIVEPVMKQIVERIEKQKLLKENAIKDLENFKGNDIGFVKVTDVDAITILTPEEAKYFLNTVFSTNEKKAFVELNQKIVLYSILEQKLFDGDNVGIDKTTILSSLENVKKDTIRSGLLSTLKSKYKIETYYEGI